MTIIAFHIPIFTFTFQMFAQMRALQLHLTLGFGAFDQNVFTNLRMALNIENDRFVFRSCVVQFGKKQPLLLLDTERRPQLSIH